MSKTILVMYSRSRPCPFVNIAKRVLDRHQLDYHEIQIDRDSDARQRVIGWTGFESVPTMIVAKPDEILPITEPDYLPEGESPRGIDRGAMITEANEPQLEAWLAKHGFLPSSA